MTGNDRLAARARDLAAAAAGTTERRALLCIAVALATTTTTATARKALADITLTDVRATAQQMFGTVTGES